MMYYIYRKIRLVLQTILISDNFSYIEVEVNDWASRHQATPATFGEVVVCMCRNHLLGKGC